MVLVAKCGTRDGCGGKGVRASRLLSPSSGVQLARFVLAAPSATRRLTCRRAKANGQHVVQERSGASKGATASAEGERRAEGIPLERYPGDLDHLLRERRSAVQDAVDLRLR